MTIEASPRASYQPARISLESEPSATPRIAATGVSKAFNGLSAIRDVGIAVHDGEFVAVLGPSGAGKTTLFRCIAGLITPDHGRIEIDGDDIAAIQGRSRRRIALIQQQFNLVNRLTALENVLAGRLGYVPFWRGWLRRFGRADLLLALECLDRVGLLAQATQRADTLSGGQQQRVAIARALAQRPRIIVADEPVASLDLNSANTVLSLLRGIAHSDNVSILCSLHQVHFAVSYADRIVGLSSGQVRCDLPVARFDQAASDQLFGKQSVPP